MEKHEENNIQQEIMDSMAKKLTDLEKRQLQIEELGLNAIPSKVKELENKVKETAEMKTLENTQQLERFDKQLNGFDEKINVIPKEIPVKYNVQFDTKAKFVIKIMIGMGLGIFVLFSGVISLWIENGRRAEDKNKYTILQGFFPKTANYIDSVYINNSDSSLIVAKTNIEEQQKLIDAALVVKEAAEQSKLANDKLGELRSKKRLNYSKQHKK